MFQVLLFYGGIIVCVEYLAVVHHFAIAFFAACMDCCSSLRMFCHRVTSVVI